MIALLLHLPVAGLLEIPSWPLLPSGLLAGAGSGSATMWIADLPTPPTGTFEPWLVNLLLVVSILGACAFTWVYLRDAFGRKPPMDEEFAEFKKRIEEEMITADDLDKRLQAWGSEIERKFERALHDEFKTLSRERSTSIAGLHSKVEISVGKVHERIDELCNEMPGKIIGLLQATGHLGRKG